jgi:hypothetical protein
MNKLWLRFLCYAGLLATSLGLQVLQPEMFALFCTQLPIGEMLDRGDRLELPLNSPVVPKERVK